MRQQHLRACGAAVVALFVCAFRFLAVAGFSNDHYMHVAAGQQIAFGGWPVRDYVELGLPLMELLSAIPFWVLPEAPLFGEAVLVATMFGLAAVCAIYAAKRLTESWWIALLVVALEVVIFPRTYSYPKVLAYAIGFLAMWRYVEQPTLSRMAQLAIVVTLAFGLRYDHGLYLGIGGLLTVIIASMTAGPTHVARRAASFAGIIVLMLAPYIVYIEAYSGLWRHITRGVEMQAVESARGRTFPEFSFDAGLVAPNAVPWLFFLFHLLPLVAAVLVWARWRRRASVNEVAIVVPLVVVATLVNLGLIRDTLSARLPDAVVPASLLLGWLLAVVMQVRLSPAKPLMRVAAAAVVLITLATAADVGGTKEQLEKAEMLDGPGRFVDHVGSRTAQLHERFPLSQMPSGVVSTLMPFLRYSDRCLGPRDHILIPAFAPEVSVWSRRPFAGGQVWFQPELLREDDDHRLVMSRLGVQRVPVAVFVSPSSELVLARFAELAGYVRDQFHETVGISTDDGRQIAIAFSSQLAVGRDRETGWFCYR